MEFARGLKEYYEAPVLPLPGHCVEHVVNIIAECSKCTEKVREREQKKDIFNTSDVEFARHGWGKHFTWPRSTLISRMTIARRKLTTARQVSRKFT